MGEKFRIYHRLVADSQKTLWCRTPRVQLQECAVRNIKLNITAYRGPGEEEMRPAPREEQLFLLKVMQPWDHIRFRETTHLLNQR